MSTASHSEHAHALGGTIDAAASSDEEEGILIAFFGVLWHASRMVLTPAPEGAVPYEASAWMVGAMLCCLFVVVALGVHLPGDLSTLLDNAALRLRSPTG